MYTSIIKKGNNLKKGLPFIFLINFSLYVILELIINYFTCKLLYIMIGGILLNLFSPPT